MEHMVSRSLTIEQRTLVMACLAQGHSIRDTVRITGVAKNTIRKMLGAQISQPSLAQSRQVELAKSREYKSCPWPTCGERCAIGWMFCNKCQSARLTARILGEVCEGGEWRPINSREQALLLSAERHRANQERKRRMSPRAVAYRRAWRQTNAGQEWRRREAHRVQEIRRKFRAERERTRWRNYEYRQEQLRQARETACSELLALLDEQQADTDRVRRTKNDPWMLRSLNAGLPGREEITLADLLPRSADYWSDPTGDIATALADGDLWWEQS